jgi:hypothetical protein
MRKLLIILTLFLLGFLSFSQEGQFSGNLMLNANFFDRDDKINTENEQYKHQLSSAESWFFGNYKYKNFSASIRYDLFQNSMLINPDEVYSDHGLAFYSLKQVIGDLEVTAGSFYDQFGSGIIFRAFEDRNLGMDYAIQGLRLKYNLSPTFRVKAFVGKQKNRFTYYPQAMKGFDVEKDFTVTESFRILSGAAFLNRTLDKETIDFLVNEINGYKFEDQFAPLYNIYAFSLYNTFVYKGFNLYFEAAHKSEEAIRNKAADKFILSDGNVYYTSFNYSTKGFGLSIQHKFSDRFVMRTSPDREFLEGIMNYMPPNNRQHAKVLPARYSIAAQEFGEEAIQGEITYSPNRNNTFLVNISYVEDDEDKKIFNEYFLEYYHKFSSKFKTTVGLQTVYYDKLVYENHLDPLKDGVTLEPPIVETKTGYIELVYKLTRRKSLRAELQYLQTDQDHGDFFYGLLEFNIAPHYSISVGDMINTNPLKLDESIHYYSFGGAYTLKQTRFMLYYMKQVEGVVCTGGVCRVEPAFSGIKFNLTTSF